MKRTTSSNSRSKRSILFWFFLCFSLPVAGFVVAYAAGYSFDRPTGKMTAASAISITSTPRGATVQLNGDTLEDTTPTVEVVDPGRYTTTVTRDGYTAWEKELTVSPGESLLFPDVTLFRTDQSATDIDGQAAESTGTSTFMPVAGSSTYEYTDGPALVVRTVDGTRFTVVDSLQELDRNGDDVDFVDRAINTVEWNEDTLLYTNQNEIWTYSMSSGTHTLLLRQGSTIDDAAWMPDGGYVLFSTDTGLWAMELDERDSRQLWQINNLTNITQIEIARNAKTAELLSDGQWYSLVLQ